MAIKNVTSKIMDLLNKKSEQQLDQQISGLTGVAPPQILTGVNAGTNNGTSVAPPVTSPAINAAYPTPATTQKSQPYDIGKVAVERRTVQPGETVEGRIGGIIDKDSPLMQQAATKGLQTANKRGLLNSSMAVGAAQNELYSAAFPIAQQDADIYSKAASENQQYGNEASAAEFQALQERNKLDRQAEIEVELQQMRGDQSLRLSDLEKQYDVLLRTSESASQVLASVNAGISAVMANPDLNAPQKNSLIARQVDLMENQLALIGTMGNIDLTGLVDTGSSTNQSGTNPISFSGNENYILPEDQVSSLKESSPMNLKAWGEIMQKNLNPLPGDKVTNDGVTWVWITADDGSGEGAWVKDF